MHPLAGRQQTPEHAAKRAATRRLKGSYGGRPAWNKGLTKETDERVAKNAPRLLGRKMHKAGYVLVYVPDHPKRDRTGYVLEHRVVMEQELGRHLQSNEIVHHINGDKTDNRTENLQLVERWLHFAGHWRCPKCGHLMEAQANDTDSVADDYQLGEFLLPSFGFIEPLRYG